MKTLSLQLNLDGITLDKQDEDKSPQEIMVSMIRNIMLWYGNRVENSRIAGFNEEERRFYFNILNKLEEAIKEKLDSVELEDTWMGFLRKCKREGCFIPNQISARVEQLINDVRDR